MQKKEDTRRASRRAARLRNGFPRTTLFHRAEASLLGGSGSIAQPIVTTGVET